MSDVPPSNGSAPSATMVQEKKKIAANIAMAFMNHQQLTQQLAQQMTQVMQALVQQNQVIVQLLMTPKESVIVRDPQTGDIVKSIQTPIQQPQEQAPQEPGPMMPPQGVGM